MSIPTNDHAASLAADQTSYRALFKVPGFGLLLLSSLAARIAVQMFSILIVLFVFETHHSSELSGIVVLCSQVPGILVSPIAGALLDRGSRLSLMVLDYLFGSSCIALIGVLSLVHHLPTVALILIVSVSSITSPLSRVGGKSLYPIMVPRLLWDRSNAVDSGGFVVATVLGPGVAGIAVAVLGPRAALLLPAGVMLLAAVLLIKITLPDTRAVREVSVMEDAVAAIRYVWANGVLRMLAGTMTVLNVAGGTLSVALPFVVLRVLHGGSTTVGLLFAVMGVSGFLAGIATGVFGTEGREKRLLAASCMVTAAAFAVLVAAHGEVLLLAMVAVVGMANGPLTVAMFSLRQRATEPQWFGRAFAVSMNLNFVGSPIGATIAGLVLAHSVPVTFAVAGACALIGGLWPAFMPASSYEPATPVSATPVSAPAELALGGELG